MGTAITYATFLLFYLPWLWERSLQILNAFGLDQSHEIIATVVFFLLDGAKDLVLGLPWSLYNTFVIEQRHGFNKQTLGLFFTDMLKQVRKQRHSIWPLTTTLAFVSSRLSCMHRPATTQPPSW